MPVVVVATMTVKPESVDTVREILTSAGDFECEVLDADPRRVKRLKIMRRTAPRRRTPQQDARAEKEAPEATDKPSSAAWTGWAEWPFWNPFGSDRRGPKHTRAEQVGS